MSIQDVENVFLSDEEDISVEEMEARAQREAEGLEEANIVAD